MTIRITLVRIQWARDDVGLKPSTAAHPNSGVLRVARGGSGAKAPPLAARHFISSVNTFPGRLVNLHCKSPQACLGSHTVFFFISGSPRHPLIGPSRILCAPLDSPEYLSFVNTFCVTHQVVSCVGRGCEGLVAFGRGRHN